MRYAHVFETLLDDVRAEQDRGREPSWSRCLLRAADVLADLVAAARDGGAVDAARSAGLAEEAWPRLLKATGLRRR